MTDKEKFLAEIRRIQVKFSRLYAGILTDAGLTLPQYTLLNQLANTGPATMTEISELLHISKPAVTHLVDRLEKKKCLKRIAAPQDRRIYHLKILPKGGRIARDTQAYVLNLLVKTLGPFHNREREVITRFYSSLSRTMDTALAASKGKKI